MWFHKDFLWVEERQVKKLCELFSPGVFICTFEEIKNNGLICHDQTFFFINLPESFYAMQILI